MKTGNVARKGQSAIEYLTTYGWAILAIVVVAAVLLQMGVFSQCNEAAPRFAGQSVSIDTWAFNGTNDLLLNVRAANEDVEFVDVWIDTDSDDTYDDVSNEDANISAGSTQEIYLNMTDTTPYSSGECASAQIKIEYEVDDLSDRLNATGSGRLTGPVP